MKTQQKSEKGQALILIVIGFVILLGFVGLAIDGGRVYSDRRHAQNSSDASSLAGGAAAALNLENSHLYYGLFDCANDDGRLSSAIQVAREAAVARAFSNGFTISLSPSAFNYVRVICVSSCPTCGGFASKYLDVTVNISTTTPTTFASLLFKPGLNSQVTATTRVYPRMPLAYGHAIVATGKQDCSGNQYGTIFGGSSKVNIVGGGVFSNGCMNGNGNAFEVRVIGGSIMYAGQLDAGNGDWYQNGNPDPPDKAGMPLPPESTYIPPPNCDDPNAHVVETLSEGSFPLEAGLWCVTGTANIKINGGDIYNEAGGVTIYFAHADVEIDGGKANVNLFAPDTLPDPKPAVPGLLFYLAEGDLDMTGNNTTRFEGTIYAPNGDIKAHGTAGMKPTFNTQLIGEHVDVSGNYDLDIVYDQGKAYSIPTGIELNR